MVCRRIPMRWVWMPLAKVQEGLGGKARAISALVVVALSLLGSAMYLVPYPLKMDSSGNLLPVVRRIAYPPETGMVESFSVNPNACRLITSPDPTFCTEISLFKILQQLAGYRWA